MEKQNVKEQKQESNKSERKLISMMSIPFIIIIINGIDIVKEMLTVSGNELEPINIFMLVMAVISVVVLVVNAIKWFKERKETVNE